ncbi:MAG: two-component system, cell cycle sensor histidine kinase and response regulator CckA [Actinomycetota bacterium]|nr:two-component system, cell cycle sensor histidine kinase and response regulator CckA [Actinomycetota bacterium]
MSAATGLVAVPLVATIEGVGGVQRRDPKRRDLKGRDPHGDVETRRPRRHHSRRLTALVLAAGLSTSVVLSVLTAAVVRRSQQSLLVNQSSVAASAIGALIGQIRSSLDAVVMVAVVSNGDPAAIQRATAALPAVSAYPSLVVLAQQSGHWVPAAVVRPASVALTGATAPFAPALQSVPDKGIHVLGFAGTGPTRRIAVADRPPGVTGYEVYIEVPLAAAAPASGTSTHGQPMNDLSLALYLHDSEQPANLVFASSTRLPLEGTRAVVHVSEEGTADTTAQLSTRPGDTTGPPDALLMVFSPKEPLGGALAADLAWIGLASGIVASCAAAAGFASLLRSRNHSLDLVNEMQASNEMRDDALAERAKAEQQRGHLEAQLRQAQRMEVVGQLAGGIAHDFNNLLAVILNFGHFVLKALHDHPAEADVKDMLRAAQQAADLTRQLLVFSRKDVVHPEAVDINAVVEGTVRLLGRTLGEHIELRLDLDPTLPAVEADVGGLEQILMNLAVNARDSIAESGRLTISTSVAEIDASYTDAHVGSTPGSHVLLEVSDTGCGMSSEVTLQIFEPFFTTKPSGVGTGMGLATVYGIVSRWGGHISVYSEVDIGTVFKIWLPVVARPAAERQPLPVRLTENGDNRTVLLVEDEPGVRRAAKRILESAGYRVVEAANAAEALAAFGNGVPDVVVSDVIMPGGLSGKALAEQFRSVAPHIPVLFMSGYTADIITARGVLDPNVLLIEKPFTAEVLLDGVRRALRGDTTGDPAHLVPRRPE